MAIRAPIHAAPSAALAPQSPEVVRNWQRSLTHLRVSVLTPDFGSVEFADRFRVQHRVKRVRFDAVVAVSVPAGKLDKQPSKLLLPGR